MKNRKNKRKNELRSRMFLTVGLLILFRVLSHVPVPFVDLKVLDAVNKEGGLTALSGLFSGGAMQSLTLMATGVSSYITASIIIQSISFVNKNLHELARTPGGQKTIQRYTLILGLAISFVTSVSLTFVMNTEYDILTRSDNTALLLIALVHTIGTFIAVSIGEKITEKGFGNGLSLLIMVNIISSFPQMVLTQKAMLEQGLTSWLFIGINILILLIIIASIVFIEQSELRLFVRYTHAIARGETGFSDNNSHLPLKLNMNGVMPIILASSFQQLLQIIAVFFPESLFSNFVNTTMVENLWINTGMLAILILLFAFMYSFISFDAHELAENLQKNGGSLLKVRPGRETAEYLETKNDHLTFLSAVFLILIASIPTLLAPYTKSTGISATSFMIIVGVILESVNQYKNDKKLQNPYKRSGYRR